MPITKAKRRANVAATEQLHLINMACLNIREARDFLRQAGSKKAADYAQRALKSAEGAERHALRMANEEARRA